MQEPSHLVTGVSTGCAEQNDSLMRALRESEQKYRTMVEHSNDAIWTLDSSGNFLWFNKRAELMTGHRLEDWVGRSFVPLIAPEDLPKVKQVFDETMAGRGRSYEVNVYKKSGGLLTLLVNTTPFVSEGEVVGTVSFANDITERKQAEAQLWRRNNELEAVNAIGAAVSSSLDLDRVLAAALDTVLRVMDLHPVGGIFLLDQGRRELRLAAHRGLDKKFVEREGIVPLGECLCGLAAESGRLLFSSDSAKDERHTRLSGMESHAHVVVPLKSHDRVEGVLFLYPPPEYTVAAFEERLYAMVGRQIGVAIENARLYQKTDEQLQKKVIELTEALGLAETERTRARDALQVREEFLSVASHELKTPMTSLRGFVQLATRQIDGGKTMDPERVRRALKVIDQQSEKLSRLISQLLDISRIESGQLALAREATDVTALVEAVVKTVQPASLRHTLVFRSSLSVSAMVDPLCIEQVVVNLISNATKYSPKGGQIDVEVSAPEPGTVRIAVTDRGIGISPEHRDRVFDRFYQAHAGDHFGGIGLGLYVSREIVSLHGGHIDLDIPDEGGTRFAVVLPTSTRDEPSYGAESAAKPAGRVLVVDDDEAIVKLVHMTLSEEGYEVMDAAHGAAALDVIEQWRPDLILLDLRMPLMDGREFARAYRRTPGPHSPIVLLTAAHDLPRPVGETEADAYLEKPFDLDRLLEVVGQYSGRG